jgi:hypothetical protein
VASLEDDLAYLRGLTREEHTPAIRAGAIMVAAGVVFGLSALRAWAYQRGLLAPPWTGFPPFDAVFVFLSCLTLIRRRWPQAATTAAARGLSAAMNSIGVGVVVTAAALAAAGRALDDPNMMRAFPAILFVLYGSAWSVAFAVTRRKWTVAVAGGAFGFAMICASLAARPEAWLALAVGLWLLVAAPGWLLARAERWR